MSSKSGPVAKPLLSRRNVLRTALAGAGLAVLAGCQGRPRYSDAGGGPSARSATADALASIVIDPPSDRTTQRVRNELVFGTNSGGAQTQFRLALRASSHEETLGVRGTGAAFARTVRVTASYQLFRLGQLQPVLENTVISTASYDSVEQRFANQRAAIDAEARAARDVAQIIEAQLASTFARSIAGG